MREELVQVVTRPQMKELIKSERIRPEDLFEAEDLKPLLDKARAEGYADARLEAIRQMSQGPAPAPKGGQAEGPNKYLDPARNPFIKLEPDK